MKKTKFMALLMSGLLVLGSCGMNNTAKGGLIGPSALNSMEEPDTKAPAAMITLLSYPGISHGSGVTKLSIGAAFWMPSQKAMTPSGVPKVTA